MLIRVVILVFAVLALPTGACYGSSTNWDLYFLVDEGGGFTAGVKPNSVDAGILMPLYRQNGPGWSGLTGFYGVDYMSPIPSGTSKTWSDIYLWAQNHTPILGDRVGIGRSTSQAAPAGYWASLVIDYVPPSITWTGPWEYDFPLDWKLADVGLLPVPITSNPSDPTQVTRMHLTVYTPEPSSLLALLAGLAGFGAIRRRRG
jgi:hypothetical protein